MKYDFNDGTNEAQLAFYPTDGGTYRGKSKDSSRFSINPVNADDSVPQGTNTKEKNSIVVRGAHTFKNVLGQENFSTQLGASAWYSTIENKRSGQDGDRQVYSVLAIPITTNGIYSFWLVIKTLIMPTQYKDHLTLGGFDYSFNSATKGQIYSAELSYLFPQQFGPITSVRPYLNYSSYRKEQDGFKNSTRFIPGIAFNYQN